MTYWQVRADLGGGRTLLFGLQAPDLETAWAEALLIAESAGDASIVVQEITPPRSRPAWAGKMKRSDITDGHVLELARHWRGGTGSPGVIAALVAEGVPEKVALAKVEHMARRRLLDYGVSPYYAWPAS